MFDSIRDKFHSFQENINSTLRGLTVSDTPNRKQVPKQIRSLNYRAGTTLLEKFQTSWFELHESCQENATKAQEVNNLICDIHTTTEKQWKDIAHITGILSGLPDMVHALNDLCNKTVALKNLFDNIEKNLIELEDILDMRDLKNKQIECAFQLELQKDRRLTMLETLRISLDEKYKEKLRDYEAKQLIRERQQSAEENSNLDMKLSNTSTLTESKNTRYDELSSSNIEKIEMNKESE